MPEKKFERLIKDSKRILIVSHVNPDGDSLGSSLALAKILKSFGKKVVIYTKDPVPWNLAFLPGIKKVVNELSGKFDITIILDCSSSKRVSEDFVKFKGKGKLIIIDHHASDGSQEDAVLVIRDKHSAAVGDMILSIFLKLKWKIDLDVAKCLYCAIVTDTSFFRYANVTPDLFDRAALLVRKGVSPVEMSRQLEEEYPFERFKLLGLGMNSMRLALGGKFCLMEISQKMLKSSKADIALSEEFANIPRSVNGVVISALLREKEKNKIRVSLRSKGNIDVARLASKFNGGGHKNAAGCTIDGKMENVKKMLIDEVKKMVISKHL